jgi:hypothetical protein
VVFLSVFEIYHFSVESQVFSIESRRHKIIDTVPNFPQEAGREERREKGGS